MASIERQYWAKVASLDEAQAQLTRRCAIFDASDRTHTIVQSTTATIAPIYPNTLYESDTTAGAVTLTFPAASTVPGFRIESVKTAGANALTVNALVVTTFAAWVSTGTTWRRVA